MEVQDIVEKLGELVLEYAPKLIYAVITLVIGLRVIKVISKSLKRRMDKKELDASLKPFFLSMTNISLKAVLVITVLSMLGIEMTSFVAILGAAGLAIGMALSGTLQNFAGGVMILIFKPFKVGDFIEAKGYAGKVSEIQIFNTILKTGDNKTIIIPNGGLSTSSMKNFSVEAKRRVDWEFGISYGDDAEKAKAILLEFCQEEERIINEPAEPFTALMSLGDSSINIVLRAWVKSEDYWAVFYAMNDRVYKEFPERGLSFPFPTMDVHVHKEA